MKKPLAVLLAGLTLSSLASAQLLGIGAGLGADAGVGVGAGVRGLIGSTTQIFNHTTATVNSDVSAGVRSSVAAPPPAVSVESRGRVEAGTAARGGSGHASRVDLGSSGTMETGSSGLEAVASPAPTARPYGSVGVEAQGRFDAGAEASAAHRQPVRERAATATGATGHVGVGAHVTVPRVDLGVRSGTEVRGGAAAVR